MIVRLFGDASGETHFAQLELLDQRSESGEVVMRALEIEPTKLGVHEVLGRAPSNGFHCTVPRKVITVLRGCFEIFASDGTSTRFGPGDCLVTDDRGTKGHAFEDVGDEPLQTLIIEISDDWQFPA